jgi:hypothetical protein
MSLRPAEQYAIEQFEAGASGSRLASTKPWWLICQETKAALNQARLLFVYSCYGTPTTARGVHGQGKGKCYGSSGHRCVCWV